MTCISPNIKRNILNTLVTYWRRQITCKIHCTEDIEFKESKKLISNMLDRSNKAANKFGFFKQITQELVTWRIAVDTRNQTRLVDLEVDYYYFLFPWFGDIFLGRNRFIAPVNKVCSLIVIVRQLYTKCVQGFSENIWMYSLWRLFLCQDLLLKYTNCE